MLLNKISKIAIMYCDDNDQKLFTRVLAPISKNIIFLQDIQDNLFDKEPPEIIIMCSLSDVKYCTDQIRFFRNHIFLNKTSIIVVEKEIQPSNVQSYVQAGCDFVIPYQQINQLPTVVDIFSDLSQYKTLQNLINWEQIFNYFHQPIFVCDENFYIYLANKRASSVLQNHQQTMQGLLLRDYLLPKQADDIKNKVYECISKNTTYQNLQIFLKTFSNDYIPCSLSIQNMGMVNESKTGILYIFQENSEIESIKLKSFLLQSVLDKSSSSILITNAQGTIFYANPSLLKKIQLDSSNVLSRSSEELPEEYQLHKRADAFPYTTLGFTYFHENDYLDPSGDYIHEREKILPILYNSEKKEGFLIRITEYMKQNQKQDKKHNQWFQELLKQTSSQIDTLHNASQSKTSKKLHSDEKKFSFQRILRNLMIVQEFYSIKAIDNYSFDYISFNELIDQVAQLFPDYSHAITLRLHKNIPKAFAQKEKLHFILITLLGILFEGFNELKIHLNTTTHKTSILFVLRALPKNSLLKDPRGFLYTLFEEDLWIVKQMLSALSIAFEIHNEFDGGFAFFFTIPSINDNRDYKEQEISELL